MAAAEPAGSDAVRVRAEVSEGGVAGADDGVQSVLFFGVCSNAGKVCDLATELSGGGDGVSSAGLRVDGAPIVVERSGPAQLGSGAEAACMSWGNSRAALLRDLRGCGDACIVCRDVERALDNVRRSLSTAGGDSVVGGS